MLVQRCSLDEICLSANLLVSNSDKLSSDYLYISLYPNSNQLISPSLRELAIENLLRNMVATTVVIPPSHLNFRMLSFYDVWRFGMFDYSSVCSAIY